jgi:hypothetical protein
MSSPPIQFSELLENFLKREGYLELTVVDIQRWIKSEHLKREQCIPLPLTTKRYAICLYKLVHPSQPE